MKIKTWSHLVALLMCFAKLVVADLPPGIVDTQPNGEQPPTPQASLAKVSVPEGFHVTLFAAEPQVHQPIAMAFDDRGRLWVAECYSYPGWQQTGKDRILIFEDVDNDGQFDARKVFADNLSNVTGLAIGFGGAWVCSAPHLLFIPDHDQNDVPDAAAVVKLDGWNAEKDGVEHNVFNGMKWGPDGWLYGGHGILDSSLVGKPGTPANLRQRLNCGIWRYHPIRETFEVVAHGTTNPWGIDFNEMGHGFFTNSVIGHFWHLLPGARYQRMYGRHFDPHTYTMIDACADHVHWGASRWQDSRGGVGAHSEAGGGHAHVGALIYQGGRWPAKYNGTLLTANLHGNRLNNDALQPNGSGYKATHAHDFFHGNDPWFRGIGIRCGPDGNVYVSDWTDLGECHDNDGTHRSSGRIYKVSFGGNSPPVQFDLTKASDRELLGHVTHDNKWFWEHARRLLHERAAAGRNLRDVIEVAQSRISTTDDVVVRVRLCSLIALVGGADDRFLDRMLGDTDSAVQSWAVRHLSQETLLTPRRIEQFVSLATQSVALPLRLDLTIALQRVKLAQRWDLATALLRSFPSVTDPNLMPMTWFGIEDLADHDSGKFLQLLAIQQSNLCLSPIREFVVRRHMAGTKDLASAVNEILEVSSGFTPAAKGDVLSGLQKAMEGRRLQRAPSNWDAWTARKTGENELELRVLGLGAKFNDARAVKTLSRMVRDVNENSERRSEALGNLAAAKANGTLDLLVGLLDEDTFRIDAIRKMGDYNSAAVPKSLLARFSDFDAAEKTAAVSTLCSSGGHVRALLRAVSQGRVAASDIKPVHAARIARMKDPRIRKQLIALWGDVRSTPREAQQKIADWKAILTSKKMDTPQLDQGKKLYAENCGKCHKLFGEGGDIGPELTGSDRRNLDYLLENVITPSAVVGKDYRMQTVLLKDGRVLSGVIQNRTDTTLTIQTAEQQITVEHDDIESVDPTDLSLMPAGQFDVMSPENVRDLVGYLRSTR